MIALALLFCGAAPPAARDASLPGGAIARLATPPGSPRRAVRSAAFWPDGKVLVTATRIGVRFWHQPTNRWHRFVPAPPTDSSDVLLDARGQTALFVGRKQSMHGYDLRRARPLPRIATKDETMALVLSADGSTVARAESDRETLTVRVWHLATGHEKIRFYLPSTDPKRCTLALSPNGKLLAAVLEDRRNGVVYSGLVRTTTCREVESFGDYPVRSLAFSPDGTKLAIVRKGSVSLHSGYSGRPKGDILLPGLDAERAKFSPDGRLLALSSNAGDEKKLDVLELASEKMRLSKAYRATTWTAAVAFSPRGGRLVTNGLAGKALMWDIAGRYALGDRLTRNTVKGLSSRSAETGQRALAQLMRSPKQAVAYLRKHIRPALAPIDEDKIQQLIALADDDDPVLREKAQTALLEAGHLALSPLRVARRRTQDKEIRDGMTRLINQASYPIARRVLRDLRAVEALEKLGTREARRLLRELAARGDPLSELTEAAWAALDRMEKRR